MCKPLKLIMFDSPCCIGDKFYLMWSDSLRNLTSLLSMQVLGRIAELFGDSYISLAYIPFIFNSIENASRKVLLFYSFL